MGAIHVRMFPPGSQGGPVSIEDASRAFRERLNRGEERMRSLDITGERIRVHMDRVAALRRA